MKNRKFEVVGWENERAVTDNNRARMVAEVEGS